MADLLGGRAASLERWIRTGLSVGQPIDQEVVDLLEAYCNGQTSYAAYEKLEKCCQVANEKVFKFKIHLEELLVEGNMQWPTTHKLTDRWSSSTGRSRK